MVDIPAAGVHLAAEASPTPVTDCTDTQVGGFVLGPTGVLALRWFLSRKDVVPTPDCALHCHLAPASAPFLRPHLQRTTGDVRVFVYQGNQRQVLTAPYRVVECGPDYVLLRPSVTCVRSGARALLLESLCEWGIDHTDDAVRFPLPTDAFTTDCILYDALSQRVEQWCGLGNRFGAHCVVLAVDRYPSSTAFQCARRMATHYRFPTLVVFPLAPDDRNLQCILFQPGTGENIRVHFGQDADRMRIVHGEIGDTP